MTNEVVTDLLRCKGSAFFDGDTNLSSINFPQVQGVDRIYNVIDFGAFGDGFHDDTLAIQAAINAAEAVFGGAVGFPYGTYKLTDTLRIKHSITLRGMAGNIVSADSDYTTDAGAPNVITTGVVLWQSASNKDGLLVRQSVASTYKILFRMEDISWIGQITSAGVGPSGTSGDGIIIDPQDDGFGIQCFFKNVSISYFRGYGLNLVTGWYGSHFEAINIRGSGLAGMRMIGATQGETSVINLRSFANGANGATEADMAGLYVESASGLSLYRVSCTENYGVQAYFKGAHFAMTDFQAESFHANASGDRCIILDSCRASIRAVFLSPPSGFLGKCLDLRSTSNSKIESVDVFASLDSSAFHVYEDSGCGGNVFNSFGVNGTLYTSLRPDSTFGFGSSADKLVLFTPGASFTQYVKPGALASTWTLTLPPDPGTNNYGLVTNGSGTTSWVPLGGITGIVSSGTANRLAYYASSGTTVSNLSAIGASSALASDSNGLPVASATTATELGFVSGVTSAIQTQMNLKAPLASPALTGSATAATLDVQTLLKGKGTATNDSAASGYIGEYIESLVSTGTSITTSSVYFDATSITLTAGDWDIDAIVEVTRNGATFTSTDFQVGISTTTGNSGTGLINGVNAVEDAGIIGTSFTNTFLDVYGYRVSIASSVTYFLKLYVDTFTVGNPKYQCRLSARRRR